MNRRQRRVTVIVGAGAIAELSKLLSTNGRDVGTSSITRCIKCVYPESAEYSDVLDRHYGEECNFEDLMHLLELMHSFLNGKNTDAIKKYRPVLNAVLSEKCDLCGLFDLATIIKWQHKIIHRVADLIYGYDSNVLVAKEAAWYRNFWKKADGKVRLDIINLNYDTSIAQCLQGKRKVDNLVDGFIGSPTLKRFSPINIIRTKKHRLMNIHGSIRFGFSNTQIQGSQFNDLFKYDSYQAAKKTWPSDGQSRSQQYTQTREGLFVSPIIAGLRKPDRIIYPPYSTYYMLLNRALIENSSLLIIGYSFGDIYLNELLQQYYAIHGEKRRVVLIDRCPKPKEWDKN